MHLRLRRPHTHPKRANGGLWSCSWGPCRLAGLRRLAALSQVYSWLSIMPAGWRRVQRASPSRPGGVALLFEPRASRRRVAGPGRIVAGSSADAGGALCSRWPRRGDGLVGPQHGDMDVLRRVLGYDCCSAFETPSSTTRTLRLVGLLVGSVCKPQFVSSFESKTVTSAHVDRTLDMALSSATRLSPAKARALLGATGMPRSRLRKQALVAGRARRAPQAACLAAQPLPGPSYAVAGSVVFARRPDKTWRLCHDCGPTTLNQSTRRAGRASLPS